MRQSINYFLGMLALFVLFAACTRDRPLNDSAATTPTTVADGNAADSDVSAANAPAPANNSSGEPDTGTDRTGTDRTATATPVPPATAIPETETRGASTFQYTVKSGDTLFSIAQEYGTDIAAVQQLNFLFNETIRVGQVLRLPLLEGFTESGRPTPTPAPFRYPIQSGDTLTGIAQKFGVSTDEIVRANNIVDTNSLYVGQEIVIPGAAANNVVFDSGSTQIETSSANQAVHIVRPGEGLLAIAERYNVSSSDIANANNIQNRELLRTGQRLFIPGVSATQAQSVNATIHTVAAGQGLLQIAVQYGVDVDDIIRANNILNTELIYPGQELVIPRNE